MAAATMVVQSELRDAMESGREETIKLLAQYQAVPVVDESVETSSLLGGRTKPAFKLVETGEGAEPVETVDRQTRQDVLNYLGIDEEEDLPPVKEEIEAHDAWGEKV
jgi:hypothetical protein